MSARVWTNLFPVANQTELCLDYRRVVVNGLPDGEHRDKQMEQLATRLSFELRAPVARLPGSDGNVLATPADARIVRTEYALTPHVARLEPGDGIERLEFGALSGPLDEAIAVRFVEFALRGPLRFDPELWGSGRRYFRREPVPLGGPIVDIALHIGFAWRVIADADGRLHVALDPAVKYLDRPWLHERARGDLRQFLRRRVLYHYGPQWFDVQLWGVPDRSVQEQRFQPPGSDRPVSVYDYTKSAWSSDPPPWIRNLDPASPAIIYRYPNRPDERYGAAALCKLTVQTDDPRARRLHDRSILAPAKRLEVAKAAITEHFGRASLAGRPIEISNEPLEIERRVFTMPALRFGQDQILSVQPGDGATRVVPLSEFGRARLGMLLDARAGPLDRSTLGTQFLIVPQTLVRDEAEFFERELTRTVGDVARQDYVPRRVVYDDRAATTLPRQVAAIRAALTGAGAANGYAVLVLPAAAHRELHDHIKRELWPDVQLQCVAASQLRRYLQVGSAGVSVAGGREGPFRSYLRNIALGLMILTRHWPWALANPLHYDFYLGIDVLNRIAGLTFVYDRGRRIHFRDYRTTQKERLSSAVLRKAVAEDLRSDLIELAERPRSFVVHRDGRLHASERAGILEGIRALQDRGLLDRDITVGFVDIRKSSYEHIRIIEGALLKDATNPSIGTYASLGRDRGAVCTTGRPFHFPGTANPLVVQIAEGDLRLDWILEDAYALAQLGYSAPDKAVRLPVTIKVADDFLEPIASAADSEDLWYGESEDPGPSSALLAAAVR